MSLLRIPIALSFLALFADASLFAGPLRYLIPAETAVPSDVILLANLLPKNIPLAWSGSAQKTSLGSAPQNGATVLNALTQASLPATAFKVPSAVAVHRASRLVSREEIFQAIQLALFRNPVSKIPGFQAEDLSLQANVRVQDTDPRLEVTQVAFDPLLRLARFRLCSRATSRAVPFYVTAGVPVSQSPNAGPGELVSKRFSVTLRASEVPAIVLVEPRYAATLHLHSLNSSMLITVHPLEPGALGETIRVRVPGNGKTLQARVTGSRSLDAAF